jgi:D-glycero-D-manno-heptose 1,7-bisphosphate phosphatase
MDSGNRPAVFVDRDGTLIRDVGYLCRREQLEILPQVPAALRLIRRKGYKIIVITNQSAVARGQLTEEALGCIHEELLARLAQLGADLDAVYYCPHHPTVGAAPYRQACDCRKPNAGMVFRAAAELGLAPERSYVVGDQVIDMELAARSGARGVWLQGSGTSAVDLPCGAVHAAANLWEAACWLDSVQLTAERQLSRKRWQGEP